MIWFNLIVPIVAIIFMLVFFRKKMAIWEYILIILIPVIAISIAKFSSVHSQTKDTEYWNYYLTSAEYIEPWDTWDDETCTRSVSCGTDSDGNTKYCTETYDCSHCDHNRPSWTAYDNAGNGYSITQSHFENLCKVWKMRQFKDMNRHIDFHYSCGQDGDAYITKWDNVFESLQPVCLIKSYENKIQCSKSLFNFKDIDSSDIAFYGLYDYPIYNDEFNYNPIQGWNNNQASKRLSQWNGKIGAYRKVHMMILVYNNKPQMTGLMQESYWKRGNKNEFILCIGLKENKVIDWTYIISWTDKEKLKIDVRDSVAAMDTFDITKVIDYTSNEVYKAFEKKSFRKDFSYITVEPTFKTVVITFIVVILLTIGLCIFSLTNPFEAE